MSVASIPKLITVEEFSQMPNPAGGWYELRHGKLSFVSFPERQHKELQRRLRRLLEEMASKAGVEGVCDTEFPYRPFAQHELWSADVAFVTQAQYNSIDKWLLGAPLLVIEIKSPSNSHSEMEDKAVTALAGGAEQAWIVDYETRTITVYRARSGMQLYAMSSVDRVPVPMLSGHIDLNELFDNI